MSQSERKKLIPKRHSRKSLQSSSNYPSVPSNIVSPSTKRSSDEIQEPPSKRQRKSNNYELPKIHGSPKNLAERRLQNLRQSLEIKRSHSEGFSSPPVASSSKAISPHSSRSSCGGNSSLGISPLKRSSESFCSTSSPIQNRLKRKNSIKMVESPSGSPRKNSIKMVESPSGSPRKNSIKMVESPSGSPIKRKIAESSSVSSTERKEVCVRNETVVNSVSAYNFDEQMEWTEIDENAVINDIIDLRKEIDYSKELPVAKEMENSFIFSNGGVLIVVDTNIFLSQLPLLSQLKEKMFKDLGYGTVVVPWMVIQELDYMKESHSSYAMIKAARRAVHYINTQLQNKDPYFTGQSVMDAAKLEMSSSNPDDGILFTCIQLVEKGKYVVLLSNDINLRNKALVNNIQAYNSTEIINSLNSIKTTESSNATPQLVQKIKILLSNLLTQIIECEMNLAYGEIWQKMAGIQPPFTTEEALSCIVKYWVAVFSFQLQKQCKLKIDEFVYFLKQHRNDTSYNSTDFTKLVELSLSLCIYLKNGYNKYRNLVIECITNLQKCAES